MILHTASEGITLSKKLENDSAEFYESLAQRFDRDTGNFLSFAKENRKNVTQIERTYYGVISDAIEGGYAFNLDSDAYTIQVSIKEEATHADALRRTLEIEQTIIKFYTDAAEQSQSLMADLPRVFKLVVRKRAERIEKLESLLKSEAGS